MFIVWGSVNVVMVTLNVTAETYDLSGLCDMMLCGIIPCEC